MGTTKYFNKIQNNGNSEYREYFYWDSTFRLKLKSSSGMNPDDDFDLSWNVESQ